MKCEATHTVSDADLGYWNSAWGEPCVQVFPCTEPAVTAVFDLRTREGVLLCADCAK